MDKPAWPRPARSGRIAACLIAALGCAHIVFAQPAPRPAAPPGATLPSVTISAQAVRDPVEKSYRKMVRGMDWFEQRRAELAPQGQLRFKLLPRKPDTDLGRIELDVIGTKTSFSIPVAPDHTFTLERNRAALQENAQVVPNRRAGSMTWRTEIRSPGLPANERRLGDLRLECEVGMESGLLSNTRGIAGALLDLVTDTPASCRDKKPLYLFFADRPIFSVTLVAGERREVLPIQELYAAASDDADLKADLPYCDCEVLLDRTYFLPLGDTRWPNDTRVVFEFMEDAP